MPKNLSNKEDMENVVKNWLQGAPDREGGRKAKEERKKGSY